MKTFKTVLLFLTTVFGCGWSLAAEPLKLQQLTENVYAIVGDLGNRSAVNLGNNATFGFVVTRAGVVLIDSGGTYQGARAIDMMIKSVTSQPVVRVINSGGQDHRWLGNGYFKKQGAQIVASAAAVKDQQARSQDQFILLGNLVGEQHVTETEAVYAETRFEEQLEFELGGTVFELYHAGQAHTPGDSFVWLPQQQVMFSGDIVYVERMLGVGAQSSSKSWVRVFEAMAEFQPRHLVPGHGEATDLARARSDTYDYLVFLRSAVADFIADGGEISAISQVNQDKFSYLLNFEQIAGRNAQQVFSELEWE
jgi:glyoxylase-like metal-dependent hydrolase (beta-lactamase superfamily II)